MKPITKTKYFKEFVEQTIKRQQQDIANDLIELSKRFYSLDLDAQQDVLNAINILLDLMLLDNKRDV